MCANGSSNHMDLQSLLRLYSSILEKLSFVSFFSSNLFSSGLRFFLAIARVRVKEC